MAYQLPSEVLISLRRWSGELRSFVVIKMASIFENPN